MLLYPDHIIQKLEFNKIIDLLEANCISSLGRRRLKELQFVTNIDQIEFALLQTEEMKSVIQFDDYLPTENYFELNEELQTLRIENTALDAEQIHRIRLVMQTIGGIYKFLLAKKEIYPTIASIIKGIAFEKTIEVQIGKILDAQGNIFDHASPELASIRKKIDKKEKEVIQRFRKLASQFGSQNLLADSTESIRNGRKVLAVLAENKRSIKGIIHDESATGKTFFIEPEEIVELNNEIFSLQQEEKREIFRILKKLTDEIRPHRFLIESYLEILAQVDLLRSKAQLAVQLNAIKPRVIHHGDFRLARAFHPLLYLFHKKQKKEIIPLQLELNSEGRILVISGPNAGGKSVCLKTVGLLQLMIQSGLLIPVTEGTEMRVFEKIMVDMGDEQSLENSLSTYSSRLMHMKNFLSQADSNTLILIDEMGTGTDPALGGAIAEAILEELNNKKSYGVITTHYSNLKIFASNNKGLLNGSMLFDEKTLEPKYQLLLGKPGSSYTFEIARKTGLPESILKKAKLLTGEKKQEMDELLGTLQSEKIEVTVKMESVESKEKYLDTLKVKYESLNNDLQKNMKNILLQNEAKKLDALRDFNRELEKKMQQASQTAKEKNEVGKIRQEIKELKEKSKLKIEELKEELIETNSDKEIVVGSIVKLQDGDSRGEVVELRKNKAIVSFEGMKTLVSVHDLIAVEILQKPKKVVLKTNTSVSRSSQFNSTLDLRGERRDDALMKLDKFLDNALSSGSDKLRIIHGYGENILKKAVKDALKQNKYVKAVYHESHEQGGEGVTIAEL